MAKREKQEWTIGVSLPGTSTLELRGRQSVRATFKLTEGCIHAISIVSRHLGIKQKSLFDHLVEDTGSLTSIAREIQDAKLIQRHRVPKTYVVSRKTLYSLDEISKNFNAPRDGLVEYSVQRLLPVIIKEREKHGKRKKMLAGISRHFKSGLKLLENLERELGPDDPVHAKFESLMAYYENAYNSLGCFIERGKIIEDFDPDMMRRVLED